MLPPVASPLGDDMVADDEGAPTLVLDRPLPNWSESPLLLVKKRGPQGVFERETARASFPPAALEDTFVDQMLAPRSTLTGEVTYGPHEATMPIDLADFSEVMEGEAFAAPASPWSAPRASSFSSPPPPPAEGGERSSVRLPSLGPVSFEVGAPASLSPASKKAGRVRKALAVSVATVLVVGVVAAGYAGGQLLGRKVGNRTPAAHAAALTTPPVAERAAAATPAVAEPVAVAPKDVPFDRTSAVGSLVTAATSAKACFTAAEERSIVSMAVTFAPDGKVVEASVEGAPYAGTPVGACVAQRFRAASVPAFAGAQMTVRKKFLLP